MKLYEWLPYSYGTDVEYIMYGENSLSSEVSDIKLRVKFKNGEVSKWYYPPKEEIEVLGCGNPYLFK